MKNSQEKNNTYSQSVQNQFTKHTQIDSKKLEKEKVDMKIIEEAIIYKLLFDIIDINVEEKIKKIYNEVKNKVIKIEENLIKHKGKSGKKEENKIMDPTSKITPKSYANILTSGK